MSNEARPTYDEESPGPAEAGTRFNLPEDEARQFFDTPASAAGGLDDTARRISTEFSSTPATREQRLQQQMRRQQQLPQPSILRTPSRFSTPGPSLTAPFPLPTNAPTSSSRG